jgi:uncharacterized membrane protein
VRRKLSSSLEALAVLLLGLMAGFFFAFAVDVVPAMENLDAAGYVVTQQWINRVVRNAAFGAAYFGSALLPFLAGAAVSWCGDRKRAWAWFGIAVVYFAAVFWVTRTVNVPINDELASWQPGSPPDGWKSARDTWNQSNLVRTVAAVVCFAAAIIVTMFKGKGRT